MIDDYYFCPILDDLPEFECCLIERGRWEKMIEFQKMPGFKGFRDLKGSANFMKIPIKKQGGLF